MAVVELTKENFEQETLHSKFPVLIDFWAPWCAPCRRMSPVIEELGEELEEVKVATVNIDEEMELAVGFGVMSIPALVLLRDGEALQITVGVKSKKAVVDMLNESLGEGIQEEVESA